jgi:CheY-like chemotaxis protein
MPTVLVVDDSAFDRRLAGGLLKKRPGLDVTFAVDGAEALAAVSAHVPDIVVTDLQMPGMDGLELVEAMRRDHPSVPVILMTAHGSEEIAVRALQHGAASYVPKRSLATVLADTVQNVLEVSRGAARGQALLDSLVETESRFVLGNDVATIAPVVGLLEENLVRMRLCDATGRIQVAVALREVLVNAIVHGNLELGSGLRDEDERAFAALVEARRSEAPFRDRRVRVLARETPAEATYVVADDGPGFDPSSLPDPTDPANLERPSGRGLLLVRTFMDEVRHGGRGNEITLIKRRRQG